LKKYANGPFYDTKSPDYRDQHMRANEWEEIGTEWKIKRKSDVSSREVTSAVRHASRNVRANRNLRGVLACEPTRAPLQIT
jgi:hypothetical protein